MPQIPFISNRRAALALVAMLQAFAAEHGHAEMWQDQAAASRSAAFPLHAVRAQDDEIVLNRQENAGWLTGADEKFLGKYGITVKDVVSELAPHLEAATPQLHSVTASGDSVHEHWEFSFGGYPLHQMYVRLHFHRNQLTMLRAVLPSYRLVREEVDQFVFTRPEDLGYERQPGEQRVTKKVLANSGGMLAPAWWIKTRNSDTDGISDLLIDAQSGAILSGSEERMFPLTQPARVFDKGPGDGRLRETELADLNGAGSLSGRHFSVFAPDEQSPRVVADGSLLSYDPASAADAVSFDQVQAYYTAAKGMAWFHERLGVELPLTSIPVRVNDLVRGSPANALYVQPPFGPEIKIGKGNNVIHNLARETDVLLHELAHHVIFQFITHDDGESAVLHEGFADYFAYAINGDPYLGETVLAGKPYLRTGILPPEERYDTLDPTAGKHRAGQIWSAVLWEIHEHLRLETGAGAEKLIYSALPYIGQAGGFRDALLALLNADRDLYPLPVSDREAGVFGRNKCKIISAAVTRGLATFIENVDGSSCNLNLTTLAQESRDLNQVETRGKGTTVEVFGRKCSALPLTEGSGSLRWWGMLLMLLPLIFTAFTAKRLQE